jgi:hypothetical protein
MLTLPESWHRGPQLFALARGWDATIVVRCGNDPAGLEGFPLMAAGIGLTPPGTDLIHTARRVFESIVERGYPTAQFGSDEWAAANQHDRSAIEGSNGYMKDGAHESIETASRRRLRGYAAQYLLITILVVTANLRRLQKRPMHRRRAGSGQRGENQTTARAAAPAWLARNGPTSDTNTSHYQAPQPARKHHLARPRGALPFSRTHARALGRQNQRRRERDPRFRGSLVVPFELRKRKHDYLQITLRARGGT